MKEDDYSLATASTVMLPSRFFCPAIPVTFDEPSSIATIKSFAIYSLFMIFRFLTISFTYNLVVELDADALIAGPARMTESIFIELSQAFQLLVDIYRGT